MTIEEMIEKCPGIVKVTPDLMNEFAIRINGHILDFNKTFAENGFDELDGVELIMELEKRLDIYITDEVADAFISGKPPQFAQFIRSKKIEELGL
jgi:acyl carrier protein